MKLIDMHCDTIWKLEKVDRLNLDGKMQPESLHDNTGHINVAGMRKAGTVAQFFANFIYMDWYDKDYEKGYAGALSMIERTKKEIRIAGEDMQMVTSVKNSETRERSAYSSPWKEGWHLKWKDGTFV